MHVSLVSLLHRGSMCRFDKNGNEPGGGQRERGGAYPCRRQRRRKSTSIFASHNVRENEEMRGAKVAEYYPVHLAFTAAGRWIWANGRCMRALHGVRPASPPESCPPGGMWVRAVCRVHVSNYPVRVVRN